MDLLSDNLVGRGGYNWSIWSYSGFQFTEAASVSMHSTFRIVPGCSIGY